VQGLQGALAATLDNYGSYDRGHIRRYAEQRFDYRAVARSIHEVYAEVDGRRAR
jgi:hypothetical protein